MASQDDINIFGRQVIAEKDEGKTFLYLDLPGAPDDPQKLLIGKVEESMRINYFSPLPLTDVAFGPEILREIADILEKEN